jgi:hypothetical protein
MELVDLVDGRNTGTLTFSSMSLTPKHLGSEQGYRKSEQCCSAAQKTIPSLPV